jgi:hypothetical protein
VSRWTTPSRGARLVWFVRNVDLAQGSPESLRITVTASPPPLPMNTERYYDFWNRGI